MKKKLSVMFFSVLFLGVTIASEKIDVPKKVEASFNAKYSNANDVNWSIEEGLFVVTFSIEESEAYATYEKNGTWVETIFNISENELPDEAILYLEENYVVSDISQVEKREDPLGVSFMVYMEVVESMDEEDEIIETIILKFDEEGYLSEDD